MKVSQDKKFGSKLKITASEKSGWLDFLRFALRQSFLLTSTLLSCNNPRMTIKLPLIGESPLSQFY